MPFLATLSPWDEYPLYSFDADTQEQIENALAIAMKEPKNSITVYSIESEVDLLDAYEFLRKPNSLIFYWSK